MYKQRHTHQRIQNKLEMHCVISGVIIAHERGKHVTRLLVSSFFELYIILFRKQEDKIKKFLTTNTEMCLFTSRSLFIIRFYCSEKNKCLVFFPSTKTQQANRFFSTAKIIKIITLIPSNMSFNSSKTPSGRSLGEYYQIL